MGLEREQSLKRYRTVVPTLTPVCYLIKLLSDRLQLKEVGEKNESPQWSSGTADTLEASSCDRRTRTMRVLVHPDEPDPASRHLPTRPQRVQGREELVKCRREASHQSRGPQVLQSPLTNGLKGKEKRR